MPPPIPRRNRSVLASLTSRPLAAFPFLRRGSASALSVSGPARRLLALWPVWSLSRPRRPFVIGVLQTMLLPPSSAPTATGWSDSCRAGFAPAEDWHLLTAHRRITLRDRRITVSTSTHRLCDSLPLRSSSGTARRNWPIADAAGNPSHRPVRLPDPQVGDHCLGRSWPTAEALGGMVCVDKTLKCPLLCSQSQARQQRQGGRLRVQRATQTLKCQRIQLELIKR